MEQTSESSTTDEKAKIIVDVYGGSRVLGQDNAKYANLFKQLDAIDDVQVNFRESWSRQRYRVGDRPRSKWPYEPRG